MFVVAVNRILNCTMYGVVDEAIILFVKNFEYWIDGRT